MSHIPPVIPLDGKVLSYSPELSSKEESSQCLSINSSIMLSSNSRQQQNISSQISNISSNLSGTNYSFNENNSNRQTDLETVRNNDLSNVNMFSILSSTNNDNLSFDEHNSVLNELTDHVNLSSLSFLQTKQRKIDHRRNKSEPVIPIINVNFDDNSSINSYKRPTIFESSSTSTTSNESAIVSNSSSEKKRKSSKKFNSTSKNSKSPTEDSYSPSQIQEKSSSSSSSSATTKKKKAWYNPFQSTYRQRNEEFRKFFKDLPNDERLIVDYSCAWQKEILIQGRMYISQNYLCFYANFLKWETSLCLKFKDITTLTREKTAKVIPNAIEIRTNKNERYFFSSFATRDKTYAMIFRIWQALLTDQRLSSQQLWTMIHQSYGNDLDMTTDEEDTYNKQPTNSTPDKNSSKQLKKNETYSAVTSNSVCSKSSEKEEIDDRSSLSSRGGRQTDEDIEDDNGSLIPTGEETNTKTLIRHTNSNINKEENSFQSIEKNQEPIIMNYLSKCPCEIHLATQLIDRTYSISVERLFDYLFGDNDFVVAYHKSRRIKDYHAEEWKINEASGKRERVCTYKVSVAAVFGETTICSNEKQIIECEVSKSHFIVDTEVRNEGIKYADAFFVASRYCLVQLGPNRSHLKVTCEVKYVKSVMVIIKSFIEKNAMAALQDSYTDLNNRIESSTSSVRRIETESSNRQRIPSTTIKNEQDKTNQTIQISKKKHSQKSSTTKLNSAKNDSSIDQIRKEINHNDINQQNQGPNLILSSSSTSLSVPAWLQSNLFISFCLITMLILLTVNIFLWLKLNEIDRMTDRIAQTYPIWSNGYSYPKEEYDWSLLLKRQEEYYQTKLNGLRSILILTHHALKNVTDALSEITKLSSKTNSNAPFDRFHTL